MKLLKQYFKFHAWGVKHQCLRGQLLFAGLIGYGFLIALPVSEFVTPIVGWVVSVAFLSTIGYLLRKNIWDSKSEAFRILGFSLISLLVVALIVSAPDATETGTIFITRFFTLFVMAFIPLWLPFSIGMLIGEIHSRKFQRDIESLRSPVSIDSNRTEQDDAGKPDPAAS